jgi:hypothetical protein
MGRVCLREAAPVLRRRITTASQRCELLSTSY